MLKLSVVTAFIFALFAPFAYAEAPPAHGVAPASPPARKMLVPPAPNDGLIHYTQDERFRVIGGESTDGADNAVIKDVPQTALPEYIAGQVRIIAEECTGDAANAKLIKTYSYVADRNRKQALPDNYIFDTRPLNNFAQKKCNLGDMCKKHECMLVGYSAFSGQDWQRTFFRLIEDWSSHEVEEKTATGKVKRTVLTLKSGEAKDCDKSEQDACEKEYLWQAKGLAPHSGETE